VGQDIALPDYQDLAVVRGGGTPLKAYVAVMIWRYLDLPVSWPCRGLWCRGDSQITRSAGGKEIDGRGTEQNVGAKGRSSFRFGPGRRTQIQGAAEAELFRRKSSPRLAPGFQSHAVTGLLLNETSGCGTKIPGSFVELDGAVTWAIAGIPS